MRLLFAIAGRKKHGKDTLAKFIKQIDGEFEILHFADALKNMARDIFSLSDYQLYDENGKEELFKKPITVDDFVVPMSTHTGLAIKKLGLIARHPRQLLQYFGTDYVRSIRDDYWAYKTIEDAMPFRKVLIPDCRFLNEAAMIRAVNGKVVKVIKTDAPLEKNEHVSESQIDLVVPDILVSAKTGDFETLMRAARTIARLE